MWKMYVSQHDPRKKVDNPNNPLPTPAPKFPPPTPFYLIYRHLMNITRCSTILIMPPLQLFPVAATFSGPWRIKD